MKYKVQNIEKEALNVFDNLNEAIAYCEKLADQSVLSHVVDLNNNILY